MTARALRPPLAPDTLLGSLRIIGPRLERGGERLHGAVTEDGEAVVVEVLDWPDVEGARRATAAARPLIDAAPAGSLRLLSADDHGARSWRVLAPFDGGPAVPESGVLPRLDGLAVAEAVAGALVALHGAGGVHGDLRPDVVIQDRAATARALVFGAARPLGARVGLGPDGIGPSPEQARGEAPTPASDCHALGLLLYRVCAGVDPFPDGADAPDLATALLVSRPPALPEPATAGPQLVKLMRRLLSKAPADRPTAMEARHILEAIIEGASPTGGRRQRMVARVTQRMPEFDLDSRPAIAVSGALPAAVRQIISAAGFALGDADGEAPLLLALGADLETLAGFVQRWPAVIADTDPGDITRLTAMARLGLAGVIPRPLDGDEVLRALTRGLRVAERRRR